MSEIVVRPAREALLAALTGNPVDQATALRLLADYDAQQAADTAQRLLRERMRGEFAGRAIFRDGITFAARRVSEYAAEALASIAHQPKTGSGEGR